MPILIICTDSSEAPGLRKAYLQAHLEYIEQHLDEILVAGPNRATSKPSSPNLGSTFIYRTDNLDKAKQLFSDDPYTQNGVYRSHSTHFFQPAAGTWIGGKVW